MSIKLLENQKDFTYASQFVFMSFLPTLSLQDNTIFVKPAENVSIKMETDLIKKDTFKTILGLLQAYLYKQVQNLFNSTLILRKLLTSMLPMELLSTRVQTMSRLL